MVSEEKKKYLKEYYKNNKDNYLKYSKEHYKNNKEKKNKI